MQKDLFSIFKMLENVFHLQKEREEIKNKQTISTFQRFSKWGAMRSSNGNATSLYRHHTISVRRSLMSWWEMFLSSLKISKTKCKTFLDTKDDLRLYLSKLTPNLQEICKRNIGAPITLKVPVKYASQRGENLTL